MDRLDQISLRCVRLQPDAVLPVYQTPGAAGMDLHAYLAQPLVLAPLERALVPTGLALAVPAGYEAQVRPRSGWALRDGVTILNSPGTLDSDYRGPVQVLLINLGSSPVTIGVRDRIAQLVLCPVAAAVLVEVSSLDKTQRGSGGFGHTGTGPVVSVPPRLVEDLMEAFARIEAFQDRVGQIRGNEQDIRILRAAFGDSFDEHKGSVLGALVIEDPTILAGTLRFLGGDGRVYDLKLDLPTP